MRIINFSEEDIKQCKLALAKQSLTPLQSAFLMQYITNIEQENKQLKDNWNELKEDLIKIRQLTFTKYNKNEWQNCLSFNDDILPLIEKMKEIEQGSDSNE